MDLCNALKIFQYVLNETSGFLWAHLASSLSCSAKIDQRQCKLHGMAKTI